jgi:phospholipid transport system transporter-binding protein
VTRTKPQVVIAAPGRIVVSSPLTFETARRVCEAGLRCISRDGSPMIVVDFAGVPDADSAGLAVLIEWRRQAWLQRQRLNFANLPAKVSAIAKLSEVSELLEDVAA